MGTAKKRDMYLAIDQELCGAGLSSLGKAINIILNDRKIEIDRKERLTALTDSGKLMCELFRLLSRARKAFIYPSLEKKAKNLLEKSETDLHGSTRFKVFGFDYAGLENRFSPLPDLGYIDLQLRSDSGHILIRS